MPDADTTKAILDEVFSGGVALAGLILVFLGFVFTSFDSYDARQQASVKAIYKKRAWLALSGFVAALLAALSALAAHWLLLCFFLYFGLTMLALSFVLVGIVAIEAVWSMG